jgi:hypothetical protein
MAMAMAYVQVLSAQCPASGNMKCELRQRMRLGVTVTYDTVLYHDSLYHDSLYHDSDLPPRVPSTTMTTPLFFTAFEVTRQVFHRTALAYAIVNLKPIVPGRTYRRATPRLLSTTVLPLLHAG